MAIALAETMAERGTTTSTAPQFALMSRQRAERGFIDELAAETGSTIQNAWAALRKPHLSPAARHTSLFPMRGDDESYKDMRLRAVHSLAI